MTTGTMGLSAGTLVSLTDEREGEEGTVTVTFTAKIGVIHPDLKVGANVAAAKTLRANSDISSMGVTSVGQGFVVEPGDPLIATVPAALRRYVVGNELNRKPKNRRVTD